MSREPFPLQWPSTWKRTASRSRPKFGTNFTTDRDTIYRWLAKRGSNAVITSNLPLTNAGKPISASCDDPAIAVWWVERGHERVIACDRWITVGHNLHAIMLSLEALRGLERWGASEMVDRAFAGFAALPAGPAETTGPRPWREVIGGMWPAGLASSEVLTIAKARYREAMLGAHPDRAGSTARAAELNLAMEAAKAELGGAA